MTEVRLERIPMPRLTTYVSFSVLSLALSLLHLYRESSNLIGDGFIRDSNESSNIANKTDSTVLLVSIFEENFSTLMGIINYLRFILRPVMNHPWCFWSLINMGYCLVVLIGFTVQSVVFGELREYERQHVLDQFWNFVFYKFIFVGGVITPDFQGVLAWSCWFSIIGFLHLLTNLTKERFDFLTHSPSTSYFKHFKLVMLLSVVLCCSTALALISFISALYADSVHLLFFMLAEVSLLGATTIHVLVRFGIHLYEEAEPNWQHKALFLYYTDLLFDMFDLSMNFLHYCHMLMHNFSISVASLVILLQMRYYVYGLRTRMTRHLKYRQLVRLVEETFPEMKDIDDSCAICWEKLQTGCCRLSCSHSFHRACLRSWLERDTTCPTCRFDLALALKSSGDGAGVPAGLSATSDSGLGDGSVAGNAGDARDVDDEDGDDGRSPVVGRSTFFHFDGTRYFNWLPSLHVEVARSSVAASESTAGPSEVQGQLAQLTAMFPHIPARLLQEDLRATGSLEQTIDNILEGRMSVPSPQMPTMPSQVRLDSRGNAPLRVDTPAKEAAPAAPAVPECPAEAPAATVDAAAPSPGAPETVEYHYQEVPVSGDKESVGDLAMTPPTELGDGFRFSKNPTERQKLLENRKRRMFERARQRFLERDFDED